MKTPLSLLDQLLNSQEEESDKQIPTYFQFFFIKFNLNSNLPIEHLRKDKEAAKQVLLANFHRDFQFSNAHPLYVFVYFLFTNLNMTSDCKY